MNPTESIQRAILKWRIAATERQLRELPPTALGYLKSQSLNCTLRDLKAKL